MSETEPNRSTANDAQMKDPVQEIIDRAPIRFSDDTVQSRLKQAIINYYEAAKASHRLTQDQLATEVGMSKSTVNRILNGKGTVRPDQAAKLSRRLGINLKKVLPEQIHDAMAAHMGLEEIPDTNEGWTKTCLDVVYAHYTEIGAKIDEIQAHKLASIIAEENDSYRTTVAEIKKAILIKLAQSYR